MSDVEISLAPTSTRDFLVEIYKDVRDIKQEVKKTNGRVSALERFMWSAMGGLASAGLFFSALKVTGAW